MIQIKVVGKRWGQKQIYVLSIKTKEDLFLIYTVNRPLKYSTIYYINIKEFSCSIFSIYFYKLMDNVLTEKVYFLYFYGIYVCILK